jgi:hypothetical protein
MPSPFNTVLLNVPRNEILQEGFHSWRPGASIQPAQRGTDDTHHLPDWLPSSWPPEIWKEPHTGVIMLAPTAIRSDIYQDPIWEDARITLNGLFHHTDLITDEETDTHTITISRADKDASLPEVDVPLVYKEYLLQQAARSMKWAIYSRDNLIENEGWTITCYSHKLFHEGPGDYMAIGFGGRYTLRVNLNGTAQLCLNTNWLSGGPASWLPVKDFVFEQGGIETGASFSISCIPWGDQYLSFLFSQGQWGSTGTARQIHQKGEQAFLYDMVETEGNAPRYDQQLKMRVKTEAAPLYVAMREKTFVYQLLLMRVRYPDSGFFYARPLLLEERKPGVTPSFGITGNQGQNHGGTPARLAGSVTNELLHPWDSSMDTELVFRVDLTASQAGIYTPEVWGLSVDIMPIVKPPTYVATDISAKVTKIHFERSVNPDTNKATIKYQGDWNDAQTMFRYPPPVQIQVEGVNVYDGYGRRKLPTLDGPDPVVMITLECEDMWRRLNGKKVGVMKSLDGRTWLDVVKEWFFRCGFDDSDIVLTDPSGFIQSLSFSGFNDPNDEKALDPDAFIGDALRDSLKMIGRAQPIRVIPRGGKWQIYEAPTYDPTVPPTIKFILEDHLFTTGKRKADSARWADHEYAVLSCPDWAVEPGFNSLLATTSTGTGDKAEKALSSIINPGRAISDPNYIDFSGYEIRYLLQPPELAFVTNRKDLGDAAYTYFKRHARGKRRCEVRAEWAPEILEDVFVWLIGIDDQGSRVSYGAYRLDSLDADVDYDYVGEDMRWSRSAHYSAVFVGKAEDENTLMFTEDGNLPIPLS